MGGGMDFSALLPAALLSCTAGPYPPLRMRLSRMAWLLPMPLVYINLIPLPSSRSTN